MHSEGGVYFIYDGECPLCNSAAQALRIKQEHGPLHLIDAREDTNNPLLIKIRKHHFDLDEGMVIYKDGNFYHGKDALKFMAKYADHKNVFSIVCKSLFWSNRISTITYPWMRGVRNWLLKRKNIDRIDNLNLKRQPIFQSVFGQDWRKLPPVMKKHYANRAYTNDVTIVHGTLDVMCKPPLLWLSPIMKIFGQIPPINGTDVPTTVEFKSDQNSKAFYFIRTFYFEGRKPYIFKSKMIQIKDNQVVEIMRFGFAWKMFYGWDGEKVTLTHNGYALSVFGHLIPLPLTLLMGIGYAQEIAIDENTFDMETNITHPIWGKIYEYKGRFEIR